ncbi:hypothetical protein B0A55_06790 [Friedmanniomyces simplex]|uniref:Uncharacterized protein n=1 Tax=Friedmanniomyces simplex TaxID=329884 RepID=A0A4U0XCW9_9PEZI|nr:hypothetical protein B0A55_06790 [Friedmanniomyces simplex]
MHSGGSPRDLTDHHHPSLWLLLLLLRPGVTGTSSASPSGSDQALTVPVTATVTAIPSATALTSTAQQYTTSDIAGATAAGTGLSLPLALLAALFVLFPLTPRKLWRRGGQRIAAQPNGYEGGYGADAAGV